MPNDKWTKLSPRLWIKCSTKSYSFCEIRNTLSLLLSALYVSNSLTLHLLLEFLILSRKSISRLQILNLFPLKNSLQSQETLGTITFMILPDAPKNCLDNLKPFLIHPPPLGLNHYCQHWRFSDFYSLIFWPNGQPHSQQSPRNQVRPEERPPSSLFLNQSDKASPIAMSPCTPRATKWHSSSSQASLSFHLTTLTSRNTINVFSCAHMLPSVHSFSLKKRHMHEDHPHEGQRT